MRTIAPMAAPTVYYSPPSLQPQYSKYILHPPVDPVRGRYSRVEG